MTSKNISANQREIIKARDSITGTVSYITATNNKLDVNATASLAGTALPISGATTAVGVAIVDGSGNQITSFGGGTQYTDGGVPPAHPVGGTLEWSDGSNWQTVSTAKPLPVTATFSPSGTQDINIKSNTSVAASNWTWTTATSLNTAQTIINNAFTYSTFILQFNPNASVAGGKITIEGSIDGTNYNPMNVQQINGETGLYPYNGTELSMPASTPIVFQVAVGGINYVRVRLSTVISGAGGSVAFFANLSTTANFGATSEQGVSIISPITGEPLNIDAQNAALTRLVLGGTNADVADTTNFGDALTTGIAAIGERIWNGTNYDRVYEAANALNTTGTGIPTAQIIGQFDDAAPTSITENRFGNLRMSANRNLYGTIRDAAGNERGVNVNASNQMSVSVDGTNAVTQSTSPWIVAGGGTAGSAATGVVTIQGIASMTKLLVTPDSVALPANQSVNVSQINAVTPLMGNGTTGTGSQRVTIASDNTAFSVNATLSAETTKVIGVVRNSDGAGNLLTSNSTTPTAKFALDSNITSILGTAPTTVGKLDVKGADGDVFVRQTTAANLNATVVGGKTNNNAAPGATNIGALVGIANASAPTYTEGDQVLVSTDLSGNTRITGIVLAAQTGGWSVNLAPTTTGGWSSYALGNGANAALTTTQTVSGAAGKFVGYALINLNSSPAYIQVFDTTGAVTLGTTQPNQVFVLPANSTAANGVAANLEITIGLNMTNGIKIAATTTSSGASTVATGISGTIFYK